MPSLSLFRNLGLFVAEGFFDENYCSLLRDEMNASSYEKATVVKNGQEGMLDEGARRVFNVHVSESSWRLVRARLRAIKPRLEEHFRVLLSRKCQGPEFLIYAPGGFYGAHRDGSEGSPDHIRARRVSVVLFLNGQSEEPTADTFGNGGLTFHGMMEGPEWSRCSFTLKPTAGLLVAFRSDALHEAQPVSFGQRYAIVTWFPEEKGFAIGTGV